MDPRCEHVAIAGPTPWPLALYPDASTSIARLRTKATSLICPAFDVFFGIALVVVLGYGFLCVGLGRLRGSGIVSKGENGRLSYLPLK